MNRRITAALLVACLLLTSGCLGVASLGGSPEDGREPDLDDVKQFNRTNATVPVTMEYPPAPENLTAESASEYVVTYEEVRMHNELLSDVEETVTELGTSCSLAAVEPEGDAYRVTVECGHWYEFESGTSVGIADGAPYRTTYVVSADGIEQIGDRRPVYRSGNAIVGEPSTRATGRSGESLHHPPLCSLEEPTGRRRRHVELVGEVGERARTGGVVVPHLDGREDELSLPVGQHVGRVERLRDRPDVGRDLELPERLAETGEPLGRRRGLEQQRPVADHVRERRDDVRVADRRVQDRDVGLVLEDGSIRVPVEELEPSNGRVRPDLVEYLVEVGRPDLDKTEPSVGLFDSGEVAELRVRMLERDGRQAELLAKGDRDLRTDHRAEVGAGRRWPCRCPPP